VRVIVASLYLKMYLLKWVMFALQPVATKHGDMKIPIRYATVVKKHKSAIKDIGFKRLLHMHPIYFRRIMLVDLAKN
jgi:hypothetical protein